MPQDQIQFAFQQKTTVSIMSEKRLFQMYLKGEHFNDLNLFLQAIFVRFHENFFRIFLGQTSGSQQCTGKRPEPRF